MQPRKLSSCEEYHRDISTLIDNELPEKSKSTLLKHVNECPNCFLELESQTQIEKLVQNNIEFLTKDFIGQDANTMIAESIMERVRQQSIIAEEHGSNTPKQQYSRNSNNKLNNTNNKEPKGYRLLFNPRPLIVTSAASLLILVGSSTSMLYSFSSIQHESLNDGSLVIMVSDINTDINTADK